MMELSATVEKNFLEKKGVKSLLKEPGCGRRGDGQGPARMCLLYIEVNLGPEEEGCIS